MCLQATAGVVTDRSIGLHFKRTPIVHAVAGIPEIPYWAGAVPQWPSLEYGEKLVVFHCRRVLSPVGVGTFDGLELPAPASDVVPSLDAGSQPVFDPV